MVEGPDGPEPIDTRDEIIRVRVGDRYEERKITLRRTARGPLINDMYKWLLPETGPLVSIHGVSLGASDSILALRQAAAARDVHELKQAFAKMISPVNVVTAADSKGETAIFPTGTVPVRSNHRGTFPVPAWVPEYTWSEMADPGELPHAFGGKDDFFVHTNNMLAHYADQAVLYQVDSAPSYRFERISELISAESRHDLEAETRIQGDVFLVRARRLVPSILKDLKSFSPRTRIQQKALSALSSWNGYASQDSIGCSVFWELYSTAAERALEDEVTPDVLSYLLSFRYFSNAIDLWFEDWHHPVWDDTRTRTVEDRKQVITESFEASVARLAAELGPDVSTWTWGRLHYVEPRHLFGSKVSAFNLEPWPAPGGSESVWKAHFDMDEDDTPFKDKYGPIFRMVVDMGDIDHGLWVVDSGTSGWPGSPHYQDQYELWKRVEYAPMTSNWKQIMERAKSLFLLKPR